MSKIAVCIPSRGPVHIMWAIQYSGLRFPVSGEKNTIVTVDVPIATARNNMAHSAIEREMDYLLFIDDDVLMPDFSVARLHYQMQQNDDWDAITGVYATKTSPPEPLIFGGDPSHAEPYWDWRMGETFPIWGAGLGCTMIRVSALERMLEHYGKDEPLFAFAETGDGKNSTAIGEDLFFFKRLHDMGGITMCDGGVICGHLDLKENKVYQLWQDCKPFKNAVPSFLDDPASLRVGHSPVESLISKSPARDKIESKNDGDPG